MEMEILDVDPPPTGNPIMPLFIFIYFMGLITAGLNWTRERERERERESTCSWRRETRERERERELKEESFGFRSEWLTSVYGNP